ncbi:MULTISPECIES: PspC domain-containing protein [Acidobacteriaceae]|uniref:PspC domain-containing protein n=1 Tax=Acidobacteriaceae TaxID=204434 RepID=UPI00131D865E|nr:MULTISPECIES: PspC domain-containing protein [Acidobacteriaceae]MDW5266481.1 PspC domain-containing protein [Edaphobacter sp.]
MFCSHCGKPIESSSRFCPACGATINSAPFTANAYQSAPRMTRPLTNRMIAGVCAAFALQYGWDVTVVRIVTALFIILTGVGALAYIAAWVIIPQESYPVSMKSI